MPFTRRRSAFLRLLLLVSFLGGLRFAAQVTRNGSMAIRIVDAATGRGAAVRVHLQDASGVTPKVSGALTVSETALGIPKAAIPVMYGRNDEAEGYLLQPDGSFYVDGSFDATLPSGRYSLTLSKGPEYLAQTQTLDVSPGQALERTFRMERWIDMPARGWYSSDDHIHLRRSPADNPNIARWLEAEDVHVGHLLQMGDFWETYFAQYGFGKSAQYEDTETALVSGQEEPRTPEMGHTISLGASEFVRFRNDYYSFDRIFDRVHQLGGLTGFAHQGVQFSAYRGMTLNILRGKVDFLEVAQFCNPEGPVATEHYFRFLDLGFKLTALAGSDFPWCGAGPRWGGRQNAAQIGNARFYAPSGKPFSFDGWFQNVRAGHTFATSGPMMELTVNGHIPGDVVNVTPGTVLHIAAKARGNAQQIPLSQLEFIAHGEILKKAVPGEAGQTTDALTLNVDLPAEHGVWIAARAKGNIAQAAITTPVYVTVNGGGFENPKTLAARIAECRQALTELETEMNTPSEFADHRIGRSRGKVEAAIAEVRKKLDDMSPR